MSSTNTDQWDAVHEFIRQHKDRKTIVAMRRLSDIDAMVRQISQEYPERRIDVYTARQQRTFELLGRINDDTNSLVLGTVGYLARGWRCRNMGAVVCCLDAVSIETAAQLSYRVQGDTSVRIPVRNRPDKIWNENSLRRYLVAFKQSWSFPSLSEFLETE